MSSHLSTSPTRPLLGLVSVLYRRHLSINQYKVLSDCLQIGETVTVHVSSNEKGSSGKDDGSDSGGGDGGQSGEKQAKNGSSGGEKDEGEEGGAKKSGSSGKDDEDIATDTKGIEGEWLQLLTGTAVFTSITLQLLADLPRPSLPSKCSN